jgi:hypothetical protein
VGHVDLVSVGEREKIIFDALGDDEGFIRSDRKRNHKLKGGRV